MPLAQPVLQPSLIQPIGAAVARQLSVWPFGARTARLFLLIDPSLPDAGLRSGLVRAMQQAYFASDGLSQTRAVREAALAAHYVLRHHNRDELPLQQITAACGVAALRGDVAYVALAGDAAAFACHRGQALSRYGSLRRPRPLGLAHDPPLTLWSTSVGSDDRLVLLCGVTAHRETRALVAETLARTSDNAAAARDLAEALGDSRPAGVLVIGGARTPDYQLRLVAGGAPAHQLRQPPLQPPSHPTPSPPVRAVGRWLGSLLGLALLALVITAGLTVASESASPTREAVSAQPRPAAPVDRVDLVSPEIAVRLGPSAANVVDLAIGDDSIYTLDVVEHAVRAFPLDARETLPTPDSLVARSGASIGAAPGRSLGTPVAIQYVGNALLVIDDGRSVVQIGKDRQLALRDVPSSRTWQSVGALGADASGALLFLDSGSRRLLAYPGARQRVLDPPRVIVDSAIQPALPFDRVADLVCLPDAIVAHLEDGSLQVIGGDGSISPLVVRPPDGRAPVVKSITTDRGGGLFAADPANARILQLTSDGDVIRELRDPALAGVRQIQSSLDGRHVFGLVASGVLVFDTPAL